MQAMWQSRHSYIYMHKKLIKDLEGNSRVSTNDTIPIYLINKFHNKKIIPEDYARCRSSDVS